MTDEMHKKIVLTGYRVQYVDLREATPRTPQEEICVVDQRWNDAIGLVGMNTYDVIAERYKRDGFHVYSVEQIKPKRVVEIDLRQLWNQEEPHE